MKMKKICMLLACAVTVSCNDWFGITPDGSSVPEDRFFRNENAYLNALTDIYTQLRAESLYGRTLSVGEVEFMGQNFRPADALQTAAASLDYADATFAGAIEQTYVDMYRAISACNNLIEHIENTRVVFNDKDRKHIITGELYGLRAALHFELLRLFHPAWTVDPDFVGLRYMTHFGMTVSEPLSTRLFVERVLADLDRAAEELKDRDPIFEGYSLSSVLPGEIDSRLRTFCMNYYAVRGMRARVCLYMGDYIQAAACAEEVFEHLTLVDKTYRLFYFCAPGEYGDDYSFSREHLFGVSTLPGGFDELTDKLYGEGGAEVTAHYAGLFTDSRDTRYRDWFDNSQPDRVLMSRKFGPQSVLSGYTSTGGSEQVLPCRIPFIKLGEMALIRTEALVRQGDADAATAAARLVEMQQARDVTEVADRLADPAFTPEQLLEYVELEYRRDFFGEGQLFHYYKRLNRTSIPQYDGTERAMTADDYTWPIPAVSVQANQL